MGSCNEEYEMCTCLCNGRHKCEKTKQRKNCVDVVSRDDGLAKSIPCKSGCPCELCEDKRKLDLQRVYDIYGEAFLHAIPGEKFSPDGCNKCTCTVHGPKKCTKKICYPCKNGFRCPRCVDNEGFIVSPGDRYINRKGEFSKCTEFG